jgi:hypothetical protein
MAGSATERPPPPKGYTVERPFTPDDIGDVDEPELYRREDGTVGLLFTPEERARIGTLYDGPPSPNRRSPHFAEQLEAWHAWLRARFPQFYEGPWPSDPGAGDRRREVAV